MSYVHPPLDHDAPLAPPDAVLEILGPMVLPSAPPAPAAQGPEPARAPVVPPAPVAGPPAVARPPLPHPVLPRPLAAPNLAWPQRNLEDPAGPLRERVVDAQGRLREMRLLPEPTELADRRAGVDYPSDRTPFETQIGQSIRFHDEPLDTEVYKSAYLGGRRGEPLLSPHGAGITPEQAHLWGYQSMIWVCAPHPVTGNATFYTSVCLKNQFHHSSFMQGKGVIAAGEWIVRAGYLMRISGCSGHYKPPLDFLYRAVLHLAPAFVRTRDPAQGTTVFLYDSTDRRWVDLPIDAFIAAPSQAGRYQVSA
ncbi:MAG: hypothetical protein Q8K45_18665 [Rubrivivax sp.]|nr:hypothetical protein [Rubrivivax sp.]